MYTQVGAFTRVAGCVYAAGAYMHARVCTRYAGRCVVNRASRAGGTWAACAQGGRTERFDLRPSQTLSDYSGGQGLSLWCFNIVRGEILTFPDTRTHYSGVLPMVFQKWSLRRGRPPRIGAPAPRVVSLRGISAARIQRTPDRVNAGIDEP